MNDVDVSSSAASPSAPAAGSRHRVRRTIAAILAVLSGLFVAVGVTSVWVHKVTYETDQWVATVGPLADDARVQAALAQWTTTQVTQAVDTQAFFEELLPPRAQPLAAPLTTAVNSFVAQAAQRFFESDAFSKIWVAANRDAHGGIVRVLHGSDALNVKDGKVQLDLLPVIDRVLEAVNERTDGRFSNQIGSLTDLSPDEARAKISDALGRELPPDFGTITIFEKQELSTVQKAAELFNDLVVVLVIAAFALIGLAFAVAPDRRRIAIWVGLAIAGFMVAFRASARASGKQVVNIVMPENRDATQAVISRVLSSYLNASLVAVLIGLTLALVAYLAGPGRAAVSLRTKVRDMDWLATHAGAIQVGILMLTFVWLLIAKLTFGKLLLAGLVVGALEIALWRVRAAEPATDSAPV